MPLESEFTPPSDWCPNPERWSAPDGLATENEVTELVMAFVRVLRPNFVVELGTYHGHTTECIARVLTKVGVGRCHTVEIDEGCVAIAREKLASFPEVEVIHGDANAYVPPEPVGFAWVDSNIPDRPQQVRQLWPYLEDGGIIGVHDTAPHHIAPPSFDGHHFLNLHTPRGVVFLQKRAVL